MPVYKYVDKGFFKKWSPNMAYVLGFFAADGYITHNKRGAYFWCIQITDKKLLEQIKNIIKAEHKISTRPKTGSANTIYRLQIGSIEMCYDLQKLGFMERKTKNMVVPKVPLEYFPYFVRGYFDGDGNVWTGYLNKDRKQPTLAITLAFTSCSKTFLSQLWDKLKQSGVKGGSIYQSQGNYCRLQFGTADTLKIYRIMYNQSVLVKSSLFLERKRRVFDKYNKLKRLRS
ncbi:MAG: hypothetical protein A2571_03060 [Candidatus Vogelbacteria bacterium RIFOXYD1_FULL_44_32]|uniref:DOD-type homing endonuclease domain-containing protein n=1 Tax=Candidatus Vogelbacteria bacterium RIFOXYD1_FULL_44_32 TaxID=1802438 RepID=A0A1G2QCB5_9BACT|nr:MAG: hypothetical protein A2571_03060 [Candidatus Vogelbacteria bacterium RIFOXYD1_FULL_44_32]